MRCSLVEEKTDEEAADQQMEGALQRPFHQTWVRGPDVAGIHFLASTLRKTHFCGHLAVNYVPSIAKRWLSAATHAFTGALLCHSNLVLGNRPSLLITLHHLAPLPTLAEKVLCFRLFRADLVPFVPGSPNSGADGLTRYRYYAICI